MPALKPFDFSLFNDQQLRDLERQVRSEIKRRRGLARSHRPLAERGGPAYRNPNNSSDTWTGKGRPPKWVRDALANGAQLEELAINRK